MAFNIKMKVEAVTHWLKLSVTKVSFWIIMGKGMNTQILLMAKSYCTLWVITKLSGKIILIRCESVNTV
jgi:hypothetical protein